MNNTQLWLLCLFFIDCFLIFNNNVRYTIENKSGQSNALILLIISMIFLVIFRDVNMADYADYKYDFESKVYYGNAEPMYQFIRRVARQFPNPWIVASLFFSSLSLIIKMRYFEKLSPSYYGSLLVYLSYLYVAQDMIAIRSACAAAFLLPIVQYAVNKQWFNALMFILIATCFHYSAFIFVLILFLTNNSVKRKWFYYILLIISVILAYKEIQLGKIITIANIAIVGDKLGKYEYQDGINPFNIVQMGRFCICVLGWINIKKMQLIMDNILVYLKIYTIAVCSFFLFSDLISLAFRVSELLIIVEVLVIPTLFFSIFIKRLLLAKIGIVIYSSIVLFCYTLFNSAYWGY